MCGFLDVSVRSTGTTSMVPGGGSLSTSDSTGAMNFYVDSINAVRFLKD